MAYRIDAAGDDVGRTTGLPDAGTFTWMAWIRWDADDALINCIFDYGPIAGEFVVVVIDGGNALSFGANALIFNATGGGLTGGSLLSASTWYHIAYVKSTSSHTVYLNGVSDISVTQAATPDTHIKFGNNDVSEFFNGRLAAIKMWSGAALTQIQVQQEMRQYALVNYASQYGFWPGLVLDDYTDYSTQGNTLTETGTVTNEEGPPIMWRASKRRSSMSAAAAAAGHQHFKIRRHPNFSKLIGKVA